MAKQKFHNEVKYAPQRAHLMEVGVQHINIISIIACITYVTLLKLRRKMEIQMT